MAVDFTLKLKSLQKDYGTYVLSFIDENGTEPFVDIHIGRGVNPDDETRVGVLIGSTVDINHSSSNMFVLKGDKWFMVTARKDELAYGDDKETLELIHSQWLNDMMLEEPAIDNVRQIK